jgi:hypothetical protein
MIAEGTSGTQKRIDECGLTVIYVGHKGNAAKVFFY